MTPEILRAFAERFVGLRKPKENLHKRTERFFKKAFNWADKLLASERLTEDPYCLTEYELAAIKLGLAKERVRQKIGRLPLHNMANLMNLMNLTSAVNKIFQEKNGILQYRLLSQTPNNTSLADSLQDHLQYCQKVALDVDWNGQDFFPILEFSQVIKRHRPQKIATRPSIFDHFSSLGLITARAA